MLYMLHIVLVPQNGAFWNMSSRTVNKVSASFPHYREATLLVPRHAPSSQPSLILLNNDQLRMGLENFGIYGLELAATHGYRAEYASANRQIC